MHGPGPFGTPEAPTWTPGEADRKRSRLLTAIVQCGYATLADLHKASVDDCPRWEYRAATGSCPSFRKP